MKWLTMLACAMAVSPIAASAQSQCSAQSGAQRAALIELYTSEGCSSCPPADRWLAGVAAKADPGQLSLLAFHVDYWDEIGWPDRFAQAAYSQRQRERVQAGGSNTVYTPQVMLGSRLDLRWYKPAQVAEAIAAVQVQPAPLQIALKARRTTTGLHVDVAAMPRGKAAPQANLYLALYEDGLSTAVKAGENANTLLHHERVVRGLWGPWPMTASGLHHVLEIQPPPGAITAHLGLTAFVQASSDGENLQALSLPLTHCVLPANTSAP